ncbi:MULTISPECIES: hypothetical protein [Pontibacillus]|uniref:Uncharacterized protein n=1 Tax=Pontibacillus chungwhensis TaxID=265426 RepID=A0ABY8UY19_9BACI|nr:MULTISPECIES: hypothetical protein [Pontibacillus]MCD5325950.1 hypothetical protein [Pontibacillus sp. HN14]WIF98407.1 hypothetical protein QNI29_01680 [Pontibacillus chungwhensis]
MDEHEFIQVENFEDVISFAKETVNQNHSDGYYLNFSLKVQFDINLINKPQLLDVATEAEDWQNPKQPEHLHINHGEYITEKGVRYIIEELKRKSHSNRALMSLINQGDIIESGDNPIPSFMVLQFSLEGTELYITTYFRALEVSRFLRINIEEIRLIAKEIYDEITNLSKVKLNIFAFRAYVKENQSTLKRQEIDLLQERHILTFMQNEPNKLIALLKEKKEESTVIENNSLHHIYEIMNDSYVNESIHYCFKGKLVNHLLEKCLASSQELINLREKTSHSDRIEEINLTYLRLLENFIGEIEKCFYQ